MEENVKRQQKRKEPKRIIQKSHQILIEHQVTPKYEPETFFESSERSVALTTDKFSGGLKELDEKIKSMWKLTKKDGHSNYICQICGKECRVNSQIRDHIEVNHIEGISHPCNICEKTFRSRGILWMHIHRKHN